MSRPRILHLIHNLRVGGAETLLTELLPRLAAMDLDVQVCCLDDRGPLFDVLRERGIPGHFIGRRRGPDLAAVWRLASLLRRLRIDLLNTHSFSAGFWGRIAGVLARTPRMVTTVHTVAGWSQPRKQRLGNRLLHPVTDRIVAVSGSVRSSLTAQGIPPNLVEVIHNGIRPAAFVPTLSRAEARERLGLPRDRFLVGLVARCSWEKGGEYWVRAVALLRLEGHDVHGVLVGDGPERGAWEAVARHVGVADSLTFAGERTDVPAWLAAFDVVVCPSVQESFGITALEAQAAGVPVVATRVDGFLEVLHGDEDALLVPAGDSASLFAAIRTVSRSPELANRLRSAGRRNADRFTIERTATNYAALYRGLLAEGAAGGKLR